MTNLAYIIMISAAIARTQTVFCEEYVSYTKFNTNTEIPVVKTYISIKSQIEKLEYPRGDKEKLETIAKLWKAYYECCLMSTKKLTPKTHSLVSKITLVYAGAVAEVPCELCIAPDEVDKLKWTYTKLTNDAVTEPVEDKERIIRKGGKIFIYNVNQEDSGIYQCRIGDSYSGGVILEVVDKDDYAVVKRDTSYGQSPSKPVRIDKDLTIFTIWSAWSECSVCRKIGFKRRYGICYVTQNSYSNDYGKTRKLRSYISENFTSESMFQNHPNGIPCYSQYLPQEISHIVELQERHNKIMIAMCKVQCEDEIFETVARSGQVIESANNSDGYYALAQDIPPQPPLPVADIVYVVLGQEYILRCPGTTLRDIPITWRAGTKRVVPRYLNKSSDGRVYLNARDHIVFADTQYSDANIYSCWQHRYLAGTIKLRVWEGEDFRWNNRTILLALTAVTVFFFRIFQMSLYKRRHH